MRPPLQWYLVIGHAEDQEQEFLTVEARDWKQARNRFIQLTRAGNAGDAPLPRSSIYIDMVVCTGAAPPYINYSEIGRPV